MYDQWVAHKIPWTHASIKDAFQSFGQIVGGKHYINGAPKSILATSFQDASYAPFTAPPQAYMYYLGGQAGFITTQFPKAKPGTDFNFFPFPTMNTQYEGAVTGGADVVVAMKENDAVRTLITYLATAKAQTISGRNEEVYFHLTQSVSGFGSTYPNTVAQASAKMLTAQTRPSGLEQAI